MTDDNYMIQLSSIGKGFDDLFGSLCDQVSLASVAVRIDGEQDLGLQ